MSTYRLAQINFAKIRAPLGEPKMAGYVKLLESIHTLAEASPGFIWRMDEAGAAASGDRAFPRHDAGTTLTNLSVWKSVAALHRYVQLGLTGSFADARQTWFHRFDGRWVVLWWVPDGQFPTVEEGWERLQHLRKHGETGYAFNLVRTFPPPPANQEYTAFPPETEPEGNRLGLLPHKPLKARRMGVPLLPWYLDW